MTSKRIAVLVSGNGSNLQALIDACNNQCINGNIVGVISNQPNAYALKRAEAAHIPSVIIHHSHFGSRQDFDAALVMQLQQWRVDFIVLAGFMRILSPTFINAFPNQIINIHPSLLPQYKGLHTHQRVLNAGEKFHGCSIHLVNSELDSGQIITQGIIATHPHDTAEKLAQKVHYIEHVLYPRVLTWLCSNQLTIKNQQLYMNQQLLIEPIRYWFN